MKSRFYPLIKEERLFVICELWYYLDLMGNMYQKKGARMNLTIKKIVDVDEITDILSRFTSVLYSLSSGQVKVSEFSNKISSHGAVLGVFLDNDIVAFAAFYCNDLVERVAYLSMLAVDPRHQGCGYGRILLDHVQSYSKTQQMRHLALEVRKKNRSAIEFYQKNGFDFINKESDVSFFMKKDL